MAEDIVFAPAGQIVPVANPAAGAVPPVYTNTTPGKQQLLSIYCQLLTSGVAGNRTVILEFARGGAIFQVAGIGAVLATTGFSYKLSMQFTGPSALVSNISTRYWQGFGPVVLLPNDTITWQIGAIDAGDQFSLIAYQFATP